MNVRRFVEPDMKQALSSVRKALGEEAVILRTRKVKRGGLLSFLSKEMIEVTAATPDHHPPAVKPDTARLNEAKQSLKMHPTANLVRDLKDEISELKGHVSELSDRIKLERMPSLPRELAEHYKNMIMSGMDEKSVKELTQFLNLQYKGEDLENGALIERELKKLVASKLPVLKPSLTVKGRAKIVAVIGPTGVGKTTTLAKLVTSYRFWGKNNTALISADTYRVAAVEQLKTFAAIAGLPMEAVYQPAAMTTVLARHAKRDAVFIDTAGRSQVDVDKLDELEQFLEAAKPDEVLLCLSVSTRMEDQMEVIERYSRFKPTGIVFTKLDESKGPGMIFSILNRAKLPLAYVTCGQNVPDDIVNADRQSLAKIMVNVDKLGNLQKTHFKEWIDAETSDKSERAAIGG